MCEAREKPPVFVIENMATGAWQRQWETGETGSGITNVRDLTTEATRMVVLRAPVGPVAYNEED